MDSLKGHTLTPVQLVTIAKEDDFNCVTIESLLRFWDTIVKFTPSLQEHPDLTNFIQKAVNNLNRKINLYGYDLVVMPQSLSRINQYMLRYIYRFEQPKLRHYHDILAMPIDEELCATIRQQNVLVIDDVTTSGSTLGEVLRTLRILNEDNRITIFSLIARRDLMADINM